MFEKSESHIEFLLITIKTFDKCILIEKDRIK